MLIKKADFIISNTDVNKCPEPNKPEYAFIGRSNVGKSSLINMLVNKKNLAKTSGKPGKTQVINHFLINENWYIVDLPGYGYASVSKQKRTSSLCFPMGYFSREIVQIAKNIGFSKMYSSIPGSYKDTIISSNVYRRNLVQFSSVFEFKSILNGGNRIVENRLMKKYFIK